MIHDKPLTTLQVNQKPGFNLHEHVIMLDASIRGFQVQVASMLADISSTDVVVPGTKVNGVDDMTGDLEQEQGTVLYVSGEESIQQVSASGLICPGVMALQQFKFVCKL